MVVEVEIGMVMEALLEEDVEPPLEKLEPEVDPLREPIPIGIGLVTLAQAGFEGDELPIELYARTR
jgi:hypothetical protein